MNETSVEVNDLMFAALDHAVASIENTGPLVPFIMSINSQGKNTLTRFAAELLEDGLETARKHLKINNNNIMVYALAWDGYLTLEGKRWDSILVEAGDTHTEHGILLAQRLERQGLLKKKCTSRESSNG